MTQNNRIRRSELVCPGTSLKMMGKAVLSGADEVIFDLEDASAQSQKEVARKTVIEAFQTLSFSDQVIRAFRVNGVETQHCYRDVVDVLEAVGSKVQVLVLPKVKRVDDVRFVDCLLGQIEKRIGVPPHTFRLEVLIETASGLECCADIAKASPRVDSLIFGIADFAAEMGMRDFRGESTAFLFARQRLLLAARAAGIDAIDAVTVQYQDVTQVTSDANAAAALGFDGKWAIHPSQVAPIHAALTPSAEEIAQAARLVEAYAKANTQGLGAVSFDGEMVDAASLAVAHKRLAIARRAGLVS